MPEKFLMSYKIRFSTNIRGHHEYITVKLEKSEKLDCHKDDRDEVSVYDNHAIGVYKQEKSTLVDLFLNDDKENELAVTGKQKRDFSLVVPREFTGRTKKQNIAAILLGQLENKKEEYRGYFELSSIENRRKIILVSHSEIYSYFVISYIVIFVFFYL